MSLVQLRGTIYRIAAELSDKHSSNHLTPAQSLLAVVAFIIQHLITIRCASIRTQTMRNADSVIRYS